MQRDCSLFTHTKPKCRVLWKFSWRNYSFYISHTTNISNISDLCNLRGSLCGENLALQHVYSSLALNISDLCILPGNLCGEDLALQCVYSALALVEKNKEILLTKRKIGNCTHQKKDRTWIGSCITIQLLLDKCLTFVEKYDQGMHKHAHRFVDLPRIGGLMCEAKQTFTTLQNVLWIVSFVCLRNQ